MFSSGLSRPNYNQSALWACLLLGAALHAQTAADKLSEAWRWRVFDRAEGVSPGVVSVIFRNSEDFIYAASERGLCRYDLHHWQIVENSEPFDDGEILRMAETHNAIFCASRGAVWSDIGGGKLRRVYPEKGRTRGRIFVAPSPNGDIFLIDGGELFRVRERVEKITSSVTLPGGILDFQIDQGGVHWLATEMGLRYRGGAARKRWVQFRERDLPFPDSRCVGFLSFEDPPQLPQPQTRRMVRRELWGVFQLRERPDAWHLARLDGQVWTPLEIDPLSSPPESVVRDGDGNYYVTCEDGRLYLLTAGDLSDVSADRWRWIEQLGVGPVKLHGGLLDSRGNLWFRLGSGGVAFVNIRSDRWSRLPGPAGPPYPTVRSFCETARGELWVGTDDGIVVIGDQRKGAERKGDGRKPVVIDTVRGRRLKNITALAQEFRGLGVPAPIWIGSESFPGLLYYEPSIEETEILARETPEIWGEKILPEPIHRIVRDASGELWFLPGSGSSMSTSPRLYRLSVHTDYEHASIPIVSSLPGYRPESLAVNDLARLSGDEKVLLLATEDGLMGAHLDGGRLVIDWRLTEEDGLVSKRVWAVAEGLDGDAWICYPSSGRGVTRVRLGGAPILDTFDVDDGLAAPEVWSIVRFGQSMFFSTDAGLSRYDGELWYSFPVASEDSRSSRVIPLHVQKSGGKGGSLLLGTSDRWVLEFRSDDKRRPRIQKTSFPSEIEEGSDVVFRWVARDYKNWTRPADLIYRYRVDGGGWEHGTQIESINLSAAELSIGKHTLELEVRDLDGNRNRDFANRLHDFFIRSRSGFFPGTLAIVLGGIAALAMTLEYLRRRLRARRQLARYRSLYFGFPGAVLILDRSARVSDYNDRFPRLLGLEADHMDEIRRRPLQLIPGLVSLDLGPLVEGALAGRSFALRGCFVRRADAVEVSIDVSGFPLTASPRAPSAEVDAKMVAGVVLVVEDRTREWHQDALRSRDFRLRGIRDFADRLSVDFRELLQSLESIDPGGDDEVLTRALQSSRDHASQLFENLDLISQPSHGSESEPEADIERLLGDVVGAATNGGAGRARNITVDCRCQPGLWHAGVNANLLAAVLEAVLDNAADAILERGRLRIHATNLRLDEDPGFLPEGPYVALEIEDDGHGIDPHLVDSIFDPYYSTKPRDRARGLGLSLAYAALRGVGGDIRVRSRPGEGTTVTLLLPARR